MTNNKGDKTRDKKKQKEDKANTMTNKEGDKRKQKRQKGDTRRQMNRNATWLTEKADNSSNRAGMTDLGDK